MNSNNSENPKSPQKLSKILGITVVFILFLIIIIRYFEGLPRWIFAGALVLGALKGLIFGDKKVHEELDL